MVWKGTRQATRRSFFCCRTERIASPTWKPRAAQPIDEYAQNMQLWCWARRNGAEQEQPDAPDVLELLGIFSECELAEAQHMKDDLLATMPEGLRTMKLMWMKCDDVLAVLIANCRRTIATAGASPARRYNVILKPQVLDDIKAPPIFADMIRGELRRHATIVPEGPGPSRWKGEAGGRRG